MQKFLHAALLLIATSTASAQTFNPVETTHLPGDADAVAIADLDGDGRSEVIVYTGYAASEPDAGVLHVLSADAATGWLVPRATLNLTTQYVNRVALVVARGPEGRPVAVASNGNQLHVASFDGASISAATTSVTVPTDYLVAVDLDRDGVDEVFGHSWGQGGAVYGFDAAGALQGRYAVSTQAAGYNDLAAADLTGDGITDVAVMSGQLYASPNLSVFAGDGFGGLSIAQTYRVAPYENTRGVAAGDLDGDGRADIVLTRGSNSPTWLWQYLQGEGGVLVGPTQIPTYDIPSEVAVADVDGDGSNEVLVLHTGWARLSVYRTDAQGIIAGAEAIPVPYGYYDAHALAVGDVSGDGCGDVVIGAGSAGVQVLTGTECVPANNDLAVSLASNPSSVSVTVRSIRGSSTAQDVESVLSLSVSRHSLAVTPPSGCAAIATLTYRCRAATLDVGQHVTWTFGIRGKRNTTVRAVAEVDAATLDLDQGNNTAVAEQRL